MVEYSSFHLLDVLMINSVAYEQMVSTLELRVLNIQKKFFPVKYFVFKKIFPEN